MPGKNEDTDTRPAAQPSVFGPSGIAGAPLTEVKPKPDVDGALKVVERILLAKLDIKLPPDLRGDIREVIADHIAEHDEARVSVGSLTTEPAGVPLTPVTSEAVRDALIAEVEGMTDDELRAKVEGLTPDVGADRARELVLAAIRDARAFVGSLTTEPTAWDPTNPDHLAAAERVLEKLS